MSRSHRALGGPARPPERRLRLGYRNPGALDRAGASVEEDNARKTAGAAGPSHPKISLARNLGTCRDLARYSGPCVGCSCARGSVVRRGCRGHHWQV
jgi:hypothetical protein